MKFYLYKDSQGQWRWYLAAANNRNIANGGEAYHNEQDCLHAISLVKGASQAPVYKL